MKISDLATPSHRWIAITVLLAAAAGFWGLNLYRESRWPCRYRSYESLMVEYPTLRPIWDQKIAALDRQEYFERVWTARLDLALKRGGIDEDRYNEMYAAFISQSTNAMLVVDERFDREFSAECARLTADVATRHP